MIVIRFGHDWDEECMLMDETLASIADQVCAWHLAMSTQSSPWALHPAAHLVLGTMPSISRSRTLP